MAKRARKKKKKSVILVDDHTLFRDALEQMINTEEDLEVVATIGDGERLESLVTRHKPDIVLLDIELPSRNGLIVARDLLANDPKLRIMFLTMHEHEEYAIRGLRIGALGYILKTAERDILIEGIWQVIAGKTFITPELSIRIAKHIAQNGGGAAHSQLSDREFQVLRGLAMGKSCRDLSDEFDLSVKTVYTYRTRLLEKLRLRNDIDMLRYALRHNLLVGEDAPLSIDPDEEI
jgi:DNA-binding NarL/FixJ family response regulator